MCLMGELSSIVLRFFIGLLALLSQPTMPRGFGPCLSAARFLSNHSLTIMLRRHTVEIAQLCWRLRNAHRSKGLGRRKAVDPFALRAGEGGPMNSPRNNFFWCEG
jgi:hypothetical protein